MEEIISEQKMYKTSDLYLSAYLKAKGHKIESIDKEGKKQFFNFIEDELLVSNKMRFFNEGLINVTQYKNALQDLKVLMYNC